MSHDGALVVDGHMDTPLRLLDEGADFYARGADGHADLPRLRSGGVDAVFFAAFVDPAFAPDGARARAEGLLAIIRGTADAHPEAVGFATSAADVRQLAAEGRLALLAGIENGQALEGRVENAAHFYALGVRYLTLTWMNSNEWGDAAGDAPLHGGLSPAGRDLIAEMNRLGMLIDLAHAAPSTVRNVLALTTAPVVVSHSATEARGVHPRNLSDDQLRAVAANGGLVGVNFFSRYLAPHDAANPPWTVIVDHIERVVEVAGITCAALGSDLDGVPQLPEGFRGAQDFPLIAGELERRGYSGADLAGILGGNWLRLLESATGAPFSGSAG
ncbi:MAG: dipeptidase [Gemmatimonadota bacterium]